MSFYNGKDNRFGIRFTYRNRQRQTTIEWHFLKSQGKKGFHRQAVLQLSRLQKYIFRHARTTGYQIGALCKEFSGEQIYPTKKIKGVSKKIS